MLNLLTLLLLQRWLQLWCKEGVSRRLACQEPQNEST